EPCLRCWPPITAEACGSGPGHRRDDSIRSYSTNAMIAGVGNVEAAIRAYCNPVRQVQLRLIGWTIVATEACRSSTGYRSDDSIQSDMGNPVIERIRDVDATVRSHSDSTRTPELCLTSRTAVAAIPSAPVTGCSHNRAIELLDPLNSAPTAIPEIEHPARRFI